jgi:cysteine desulfurase
MAKKIIYLDYAATTPIDSRVLRTMLPHLKKDYGNPSSVHSLGQRALLALDGARQGVADFLGCSSQEIIFTGSATEANNLAISGTIRALVKKSSSLKPHIITSQIEHHAVLEPCQALEKEGIAELTLLPVDKDGQIRISDLEKAIKKNAHCSHTAVLVSIMYANNEIGTVQPIAEIGKLLKAKNNVFFHTDAVQAVNYLNCNVADLGVDLLTMSGHKIYGPKGVGALYIKKGTPMEPLILGGGHEFGLRSGTENVAGIVGLASALAQIQDPKTKLQNIKIRQLRDRLIRGILKIIPDSRINGSLQNRLPNNANFSFRGAEGEAIVVALDQRGIAVSTGSACSSKSLEPSHVLLALGLTEEEAHSSLRVTLGRYTTKEEINKFLKVLPPIIEKLRKISGYK